MNWVITRAFTTRLPLAVMIVTGLKRWENRSHLPCPAKGVCGMSVSRSSDEAEYVNFLRWISIHFSEAYRTRVPSWEQVKEWRGKMIAVMDYEATQGLSRKYSANDEHEFPGGWLTFSEEMLVWNEGYPIWWELSGVRLLERPFPVRGCVGMWECEVEA